MTRPSDLPPGVSERDLPGWNDDDDEALFIEALSDRIAERRNLTAAKLLVELLDRRATQGGMLAILATARGLAYDEGFEVGRAEGELDAAARFEPSDEEIAAEPPTPGLRS